MLVDITKSDAMGNVYTLREDLYFADLTVPAGFRSDGASVPRFFWRLVFPPGEPAALRAAVIHDWIYRSRPAGWSRRRADKLFLGMMILDGVPVWRAYLAWAGVRIGGWISWQKEKDHVQK